MNNNSGAIVQLADGRKVIVYNNQPLLKMAKKVILNLIDENYNCIKGDDGKPKVIIKDISAYNVEMKAAKLIGYVD